MSRLQTLLPVPTCEIPLLGFNQNGNLSIELDFLWLDMKNLDAPLGKPRKVVFMEMKPNFASEKTLWISPNEFTDWTDQFGFVVDQTHDIISYLTP